MLEIDKRHLRPFVLVDETATADDIIDEIRGLGEVLSRSAVIIVRRPDGALATFTFSQMKELLAADETSFGLTAKELVARLQAVDSVTVERKGIGIGNALDRMGRAPGQRLVVVEDKVPQGVLIDLNLGGESEAAQRIEQRIFARAAMAAPPAFEPPPKLEQPVAAEPPEPEAPDEAAPPRPERVVSTGLARMENPAEPLESGVSLAIASDYVFWLEIGEPVKGSIETKPTGVDPDLARQKAHLSVVLFDVPGSHVVSPGMERGELRMREDGTAIVVEQPTKALPKGIEPALRKRRLFFPLLPQAKVGSIQFRCNIYHKGVLIQSRIVTCYVLEREGARPGALRSTLDYVLARSVSSAALDAIAPHALSVMVNEGANGTHGFYFSSGRQKWTKTASFDSGELESLIRDARGALQVASWGDDKPLDKQHYRYEARSTRKQLKDDLILLGNRGYAFYAQLINRIAGRDDQGLRRNAELADVMRRPGSVQFALKDKPRFVVPAALIYDYPLDYGKPLGIFTVCEQFLDDFDKGNDLAGSQCFLGDCPERTRLSTVVCPSGLWGYRHAIGLPVSLEAEEEWSSVGRPRAARMPGAGGDPPGTIEVESKLELAVAISTDPDLTLWTEHEPVLRGLRDPLGWHFADTRDKTLDLLAAPPTHIVYFYCHGGIENEKPYILVGDDPDERILTATLLARNIEWKTPRPLVFINGCHTTAVEPEQAFEMVSGFVQTARAAGVIGTEITVFEPLAKEFAESFLKAFAHGSTVGEAMRMARLELLQQGNPLGLAYTAYALSNLKLTGLRN